MLRPYQKGMRWRRHGSPDGYHWESSELGVVESPVYRRRQQPLRMDWDWKQWSPPAFGATAMSGRKCGGTDEILCSRCCQHRKRAYKA